MGGYTGKILRINLTEGKTGIEPLNMELARKYLGGRGLAGKIFFDEVAAEVEAFAPENKICIAAGVLTGTNAPTSGRFTVVTKSPLKGTVSAANPGGDWGAQLKLAGYDMVILEGKAAYPVYISIKDDLVEIRDASQLWGKDVYAATEALQLEFGDPAAKVMTIGPAGENLVLMAMFLNDLHRAAGCSGVGAVMGSKNLKALIVRGTRKVEQANPENMKNILNAVLGKFPKNGTAETMTANRLSKKDTCYRCPIACGRQKKRQDGADTRSKREIKSSFASDCGLHDYEAIHAARDLCNKLGLDFIAAGCTLATGMELVQLGSIRPEELDGTLLEFGNAEGIREWIRKIAHAEGLGAKMAQGASNFAASYGHPELAATVIRPEMPASAYQGIQGQSHQLATGNQGGSHDRKILQDLSAVIDSIGMCLYTSAALVLADYTAMVNAVTGFDYTDAELLACGDRILNMERLHNLGLV
ncbi:MAG TPA: aldehyde ferredoxin oxidoreductase N-terminal domain-containing protein [Desulfitobacteriaceae bacterium]|nr:aldehyde ferredoxin oxidoreductase N-terminal domain-containing protein [Desulfitobacteriaceae bacterium]